MQNRTAPGAVMDKRNRNKMLSQEKEQWGRDKITTSSIKILMAIAWVGIQMPRKISYNEEGTSPRGAAGYRLTFEFKKRHQGI